VYIYIERERETDILYYVIRPGRPNESRSVPTQLWRRRQSYTRGTGSPAPTVIIIIIIIYYKYVCVRTGCMWYVPTSPRRPSSASVRGFLPADRGSSGKNDMRADDDDDDDLTMFSFFDYDLRNSSFVFFSPKRYSIINTLFNVVIISSVS